MLLSSDVALSSQLYDQDTKLLLLNPQNKGQVYEMDLE
jgi:hypothetical protein